jgi:hypothetical protein
VQPWKAGASTRNPCSSASERNRMKPRSAFCDAPCRMTTRGAVSYFDDEAGTYRSPSRFCRSFSGRAPVGAAAGPEPGRAERRLSSARRLAHASSPARGRAATNARRVMLGMKRS